MDGGDSRDDDVRGGQGGRGGEHRPVRGHEIELDTIEFGGLRDGRPRRVWRKWLALGLAGGAVLAAVAVQSQRGGGGPATGPADPAGRSRMPAAGPPGASPSGSTPAPAVSQVGHPLLGITAGWELFGRGPSGVVRIEFARGRVTRTDVPPIQSSGPASFVVGRDWAMIRPLDGVPGFVVRDGRPAQPLAGALSQGGPALPGPDQEHVWVPAAADGRKMILVDSAGQPTGESVALPGGDYAADSDRAGYLIYTGTAGVYTARPDGLRRITYGDLLAAGPTRWLTMECDSRYRCGPVVIDRLTGSHHTLHAAVDATNHGGGLISPDGRTAAVFESGAGGSLTIQLFNLASGAESRLDVPVESSLDPASMAWSPDSRMLFVAGAGGGLYPVDIATKRVRPLGVPLPALTQLAVRPAG
ncbi:hypothetical protein GCM10023322_62580 [Rugosimonospora acidiphila]|uniref:WD40-like Beta Propeller Repeat n=1 Tax=Rugosimonospora acidiphila TaxID=556531 RepID=A0ABP9SIJ6_9ACTN